MTRESVHQLRVCIGALLLGVSAAAQLRLFDVPYIPSMIFILAAILLFPRQRAASAGKSRNFIAVSLIVAFNMAAPWWSERTGQPIQDSPWFIVPVHLFLLCALTLEAAKTIRLLPAPAVETTKDSTHAHVS